MTGGHMQALVRLIRKVAGHGGLEGVTDAQLLVRFALERDDNAFAALVQRHGPMVLGVCGRVLRDANDAEDAFQATFLVLVRKARSISRPHLLANWLFGVARRTALEAKSRAARRQARERRVVDVAAADPTLAAVWADLRPVLDEEVERLPRRYRVPFVLCYLEGRTNEEAARIIGCPKGTVLSRLAWARERLRARLTRRGLAPSAALVAAAISSSSARALVAPALARGTVEAAMTFAGAASSAGTMAVEVISLANGVLKNMFWTKMLCVAAILMVLGLAGGVGVVAWSPVGILGDEPKNEPVRKDPPRAQVAADPKPEDKAKAPEVPVVQVLEQTTVHEYFSGRTEPFSSIQLRSRVSGYLVKVNAKDGADLKKGDVLFEIDPRLYQAELDKVDAVLAQSAARLERARADYERAKTLHSKNAISQEEIAKIAGDNADAEAGVRVARASREIASLNLSFTKVTAPMSGILGRRLFDAGSLVKADETVLATLASRDPIVVNFEVDERTVLRLRRAMGAGKAKDGVTLSVAMALADEKGFPRQGKIETSDFRVDPAGTVRLRAVFANTDNFLVPGLFCRVLLTSNEPNKALFVPQRAMVADDGRWVWVVSAKNVIEKRRVEARILGSRWLVKEGLKAGEWVAADLDPAGLRPGMTIQPRRVANDAEEPPFGQP